MIADRKPSSAYEDSDTLWLGEGPVSWQLWQQKRVCRRV